MKGQAWDRESEQQAAFGKAKMLTKRTKALGIYQAGLSFELNVSTTPDGVDWALRQKQEKETIPPRLWSK